jgi:hypothetical protein
MSQASSANAISDGSTNGQIESTPKTYVSDAISQKCSGGLCVNGVPFSVGSSIDPPRISRTTWLYFVSSPTNSSAEGREEDGNDDDRQGDRGRALHGGGL